MRAFGCMLRRGTGITAAVVLPLLGIHHRHHCHCASCPAAHDRHGGVGRHSRLLRGLGLGPGSRHIRERRRDGRQAAQEQPAGAGIYCLLQGVGVASCTTARTRMQAPTHTHTTHTLCTGVWQPAQAAAGGGGARHMGRRRRPAGKAARYVLGAGRRAGGRHRVHRLRVKEQNVAQKPVMTMKDIKAVVVTASCKH